MLNSSDYAKNYASTIGKSLILTKHHTANIADGICQNRKKLLKKMKIEFVRKC